MYIVNTHGDNLFLYLTDHVNLDLSTTTNRHKFFSILFPIKILFRFNFRCCHVSGYKAHTCQTTPYKNNWDQEISYHVPNGYYLVGVISEHHNHFE